jgi:sec-independent protein translocase protein TatA
MEYFGFLSGIGAPELLIVLIIILLLFGSKLLPKLSRSVGETASELRKGLGKNKQQRAEAVVVDEDGRESTRPVSMRAPRV